MSVRSLLTALLTVVLLSGCTLLGGGGADGPEKSVDERGMRTDLEPLTTRFTTIGEPVSAQWQSGTLGDDRTAPGPSTVWIDAVITLDPEVSRTLGRKALDDQGATPELVPDVASEVPDGDLTSVPVPGPEMWQVDAWLVEGRDVLVLSARGQ